MRRTSILAVLLLLCPALPGAARDRRVLGSVRGTPHDLDPVAGGTPDGSCRFCHASHKAGAEGPLWNIESPRVTYRTYEGRGVEVRPGQPLGSSKLCLSCHDGSFTPGLRRSPGSSPGKVVLPPARRTLGIDLTNDHPVSVDYPGPGYGFRRGLLPADASPSGLGGSIREDMLDEDGRVQCTSCHDAHGNRLGKFLVAPSSDDQLCLTCHLPRDWDLSAHATDQTPGQPRGCAACHVSHDGAPDTPLLREDPTRLCAPCHAEQSRASGPATRHVAAFSPEGYLSGKAMTCATCHDPHVVQKRTAYSRRFLTDPRDPLVPPRLLDTPEAPWNGETDPYRAAESPSTFCLLCHDGTWPGAVNIRAEIHNEYARQSQFVVGNTNQHYGHALEQGGVGCTYCHDVHGSAGARGLLRGASLYPWLEIREFPYRGRASCGSTDPGARCH